MPKCGTCDTKFHACSSCCLTYNWEYDYCCKECWKTSKKYLGIKESIDSFMRMLNDEQKKCFINVWNEVPEEELDEIMGDILK